MRPLLCALLLAAIARPAAAAPGQTSRNGRYLVSLEPRNGPPRIHVWQEWLIHIERRDRAPVAVRAIALDGGMPAHGHGLPSAPAVTPLGTGDFEARGVRFHMAGRWEMRVLIADGDGADVAAFAVDVGEPAAAASAEWSGEERAMLRSLWIGKLGPVPPDPSNRVADDPRAAALGRRLFVDPGLSGNGAIACATCHQPARDFADGRARARGVAEVPRNTPGLVGIGYARWFFWDGRRDSAWSQALVPIEAPAEMATSRVRALLHVTRRYRPEYEELFGPLPDLAGVPRRAGPLGDRRARDAWRRLASARKESIDRAFANLGKTLAAYERTLVPAPSAFDRYVEALEHGDASAGDILGPRAIAGLALFLSSDAQCTRCHNGPLFTDGEFHNIGTGFPARPADPPDFGRSIGIKAALSDEFNCLGAHADDPARACPELRFLDRHEEDGALVGAYKVPSLRNAALTPPYMHDGRYATLAEAVGHYRRPPSSPAPIEFRPLFDMTQPDIESLVAFLETLSAPPPF